ncbi:MAG: ImmA/IrrE family metallo-endopeptidase [Defluviitaleaceae bacterium]|nr:ImmA/IrrE family metallo-endopeptidase [Defluviitaleaceae bacterium]
MAEIKNAKDVLANNWNGELPVDLEKICEEYGIKIIYENLEPLEKEHKGEKISGVMLISDKNNKFIVVNQNDVDTRQRFTIAHELGHYFLHMNGHEDKNRSIVSFRGRSNKMEREANIFAAELLMPAEEVKRIYNSTPFPVAFYLAEIFDVSEIAMGIRLKEMGLGYRG